MTSSPVPARTALIVEDDLGIRVVLTTILEDEGYGVLSAASAEEALEMLDAPRIDIVLVDLRLPGIQGLDLIRRIRTGSPVPIIVVTAQTDSHDVVACLESGADDYVTKPFVPKELAARIRTILRRITPLDVPPVPSPGTDRLHLDADTAEVIVDGRRVGVTPIEFRVLNHLLQSEGAVVSRSQLLREVWGYQHAGDGRVVDNLMYRLRAKLASGNGSHDLIVTVRGFGYRIRG